MHRETLNLEYDDVDRVVWLVHHVDGAARDRRSVWLREAFGVQDVREALLATPWATASEGETLILHRGARLAALCDVVQQMLAYFEVPGSPSPELVDVKSGVQRHLGEQEAPWNLSWYEYAWLDVMVRDDIADEARSADGVWTLGETVVDVLPHFRRRFQQLTARHASPSSPVRMAASVSTRSGDDHRRANTG